MCYRANSIDILKVENATGKGYSDSTISSNLTSSSNENDMSKIAEDLIDIVVKSSLFIQNDHTKPLIDYSLYAEFFIKIKKPIKKITVYPCSLVSDNKSKVIVDSGKMKGCDTQVLYNFTEPGYLNLHWGVDFSDETSQVQEFINKTKIERCLYKLQIVIINNNNDEIKDTLYFPVKINRFIQ